AADRAGELVLEARHERPDVRDPVRADALVEVALLVAVQVRDGQRDTTVYHSSKSWYGTVLRSPYLPRASSSPSCRATSRGWRSRSSHRFRRAHPERRACPASRRRCRSSGVNSDLTSIKPGLA